MLRLILLNKSDPLGIAHLEAHLRGGNQIDLINTTHMEVADFFEDVNVNMAEFGGGDTSIN